MQIVIEVTSQKTATKRGTAKVSGKPYEITTQRCFLQQPDQITGEISQVAIDLPIERDAFPHDIGRYTLDAGSLIVDQYGKLQIGRVKLTKLQSAAVQPMPQKSAA